MPTPQPRILLYDLETALETAAVFSLRYNDYIDHTALLSERYIICASWKWLGESRVHSVSILDDGKRFRKDPHDDQHVVQALHAVLSSADVIVAHNGDSFDLKYAQTRMLAHDLPPLPPIPSVDTLKVARDKFLFNSNRLDYLGRYLKVGKKIETEKGLWLKALAGDATAIRKMVRYNQQDVILLEQVYEKLTPYITTGLHRPVTSTEQCPRCGSKDVQRRGLHRTQTQTYQRWQCQGECRGWYRSRLAEKKSRPPTRTL